MPESDQELMSSAMERFTSEFTFRKTDSDRLPYMA